MLTSAIIVTGSVSFHDAFTAALERNLRQEHVPMSRHPKAAERHPSEAHLIFATCSCGWSGKRPCATREQAIANATEHADTLNARRPS